MLYPGANITEGESALLTLAFVLRHGISDKGLEDLLTLINCHTPTPVYKSKYCFLKRFPSFSAETTKHYYCSECSGSVTFSNENAARTECPECQFRVDKEYLEDQQMFFYTMPLEDQIKDSLKDPEVLSQIGKHGNVSDIVHGDVYKRLVRDKVISDKDLTIQFNTDGARVFKSAQKSLWPIQVVINELPFHIGNNKPILTGVWFGKGLHEWTHFKKLL